MDILTSKEVPLMPVAEGNIVLFHPHIPTNAAAKVTEVLSTRWVGQGPKVDEFEALFSQRFTSGNPSLAVGSGTDALHLAYLMAGITEGDEVVVPVFTCTATNIPLLYIGAKIIFVDIDPETLNLNIDHLRSVVTKKTKAIVCVHYAGLPCDMDEIHEIARAFRIPVIEDAAHALGAMYKGKNIGEISEYTMFSFQAIKHITTGDGGLISFRDIGKSELGKRLRWFGIDRTSKQLGIWENDIKEIGYKYQMTDIGAVLGIAGLEDFSSILQIRQELLSRYHTNLASNPKVKILGKVALDRTHAAWLMTIAVENRRVLQKCLLDNGVESNQVHYRNDRYTIFGGRREDLPNMDMLEEKYLCLPLHTKMILADVDRVCEIINSGW